MNDKTKKRTNKTKAEIKEAMVDNHIDKFKEELKKLEEKYGYHLEPVLANTRMGNFPQIMVQKIEKKETNEKPVV